MKLGISQAGDAHHKVFAGGALWDASTKKNVLRFAVARRQRQWFEGLGAQAAMDPDLHWFGMTEMRFFTVRLFWTVKKCKKLSSQIEPPL